MWLDLHELTTAIHYFKSLKITWICQVQVAIHEYSSVSIFKLYILILTSGSQGLIKTLRCYYGWHHSCAFFSSRLTEDSIVLLSTGSCPLIVTEDSLYGVSFGLPQEEIISKVFKILDYIGWYVPLAFNEEICCMKVNFGYFVIYIFFIQAGNIYSLRGENLCSNSHLKWIKMRGSSWVLLW